MLAGEVTARLVGIDDAQRVRQGVAGQVMVGDQHLHAQAVGFGHAFHAGDAVVHGDKDVGFAPHLNLLPNGARRRTAFLLKKEGVCC